MEAGLKAELDEAKCAAMRWNTPLSESHAELLLRRLELPESGWVLDLGCGWGELLLRAVAAASQSGSLGVGVDTYGPDLERGRRIAQARGLVDQVTFTEASVVDWSEPADRVVCIGATHAWGGTRAALDALVQMVKPGGRLLFGDGFWQQPPGDTAVGIFGTEVVALKDLIRHAHSAGWQVLHISQADQLEWDDFESTWRLGRHRWLAEHPDAPEAAKLRQELEDSVLEYLDVYRGVLGFCYLVLAR
jgi:cyclopropane fatty-acyl-phospholipid synthase-like methyltransferase